MPTSVRPEVSAKRSASAWLLATCHPVPFRSAERRARLLVASAALRKYHEHVLAVAAIEIVYVASVMRAAANELEIPQSEEEHASATAVACLSLAVSQVASWVQASV